MYLAALLLSPPVVLCPATTDHSIERSVILASEEIARGERRGAETAASLHRCERREKDNITNKSQ